VENVSQAISRRLVRLGDEVVVVCADDPRGSSSIDEGVQIRRLPWRFKIANTNITLGLPAALMRERWDVVHTHMPTPWTADWSVLVAKLLGRGSVLYFHNETVGEGFAGTIARLYNATFFRLVLRLADQICVISDAWRDYLLGLDPKIADKLQVITNGVSLEAFSIGAGGDGTTLLFVGVLDRFHRYKGLDVLLEAVAMVESACELVVVGEGELRSEYEAQAAELGLGQRVRFLGRVDDAALHELYATTDIYILPSDFSRQEGGFTLTALEAMATGRPVVLADGAGQLAREVEKDGAGLRVPAGDAPALAAALSALLASEDLRHAMGRAARELVEREHSWDEIVLRRRAVAEKAFASSRRKLREQRISGKR